MAKRAEVEAAAEAAEGEVVVEPEGLEAYSAEVSEAVLVPVRSRTIR